MQDIDSLTKDSPIALLNALYQCQDFVFVDCRHNPSLNESNITKTFGYKSSFYLSFITNKDSLSNEYFEARKALYKTYQLIKQEQAEDLQKQQQELEQELQGLDSKARESKLQDLQREHIRKQREKERQEKFSNRNTANKDSHLILESKDKNNAIIFLDSTNSLSNLIHIHNDKIDIFTKDYTRLDMRELDSLHSSNTQIFLYSQLLLGSKETPNNPLFFGELDSKGEFIESKPIYHLIGEVDSSSIESTSNNRDSINTESNNSLSTLDVFLNGSRLTLLKLLPPRF